MTHYKILDPRVALYHLNNEEKALERINSFATKHFGPIVEDLHKAIMMMDWNELKQIRDMIVSTFCRMTTFRMRKLICQDMNQVIQEKDKQKMLEFYLIFLKNCIILCGELEDFLKAPIKNAKIEECMKEFVERYFKKLKMKDEGKDESSCSGWNIF